MAVLCGTDSLYDEEEDEDFAPTLKPLDDKAIDDKERRADIKFIEEFLSKHGIDAVLFDVTQ